MPVWLWFVEALAVVVGLLIAALVLLVVRRIVLEAMRSAFALSVKRTDVVNPRGWRPGIAIYRGDEVLYFTLFAFSWWPRYRLNRGTLRVGQRRQSVGQESVVLPAGAVIVPVTTDIDIHQLAMSAQALTGFLAWLEASPPGQGVSKVL